MKKKVTKKDFEVWPLISILIAVRNEEKNIKKRIKNLSLIDYPKDRYEVIIVSDGSIDSTNEILTKIVDRYSRTARNSATQAPKIRTIILQDSNGKPNALNEGIKLVGGEYVIFTDARQNFKRDAVKKLISNFADNSVGCVSGQLKFRYKKKEEISEEIELYWEYEKFIRRCESRIHSVPGATGAIYAIRKSLYRKIPLETILDDVYLPMRIVLMGYRCVFESESVAYDVISKKISIEEKRKIRTLVGNYQLIKLLPEILSYKKNPIFVQYISHKILRLILPILVLSAGICYLVAAGNIVIGIGVLIIVVCSILFRRLQRIMVIGKFFLLVDTFVIFNYFAIRAFLTFFFFKDSKLWK